MTVSTAPPVTTPADLISEYIWLRDAKQAEEKKFEQFVKDHFTTRMKQIELELLEFLNQTGGQSFGNEDTGMCYRSTKVSCSIGDPLTFRRHVIGSEEWDLVDWRANKTAVKALVEGGGNPGLLGLNYSTFETVGVRRKGTKE